MKSPIKSIVFVLALCGFLTASAHDGHDHTPGQVRAPHGGLLQKTKDYFVEVKGTSSGVKVYFLTPELKPLVSADLKVSATTQLPRTKLKEKISLVPRGDYFEGKVKAEGTHRYQFEIEAFFNGKRELLSFQVEPQAED